MKGGLVSIRSVAKSYGSVEALREVTIDVQPGEFFALLGPSGSGKTTLLKLIAGFEQPTRGQIGFDGDDVTHVPPNKRNVGMVFQKYALFPHMTVAQNIGFPLKMRKLSAGRIRERVEAALSLVRLDGYGDRLPSQLSGGQQQRIAVARAIVFEPPVLLMDEPLGALDKKLREQMQFEIKRIQEELGITVIYVTHDQEEALTMSDRVAAMNRGSIAQVGSPRELYLSPENTFVADFIGKMNFIQGECLDTGPDGAEVRLLNGDLVRAKCPNLQSARTLSKGRGVQIAIRPERLRISAPNADKNNAMHLVVKESIFVGSYHVVLASFDQVDQEPIQIQLPIDHNGGPFDRGDEIAVTFEPVSAHVFSHRGSVA